MTTYFCIAILSVTLVTLVLRLTVLRDMASTVLPAPQLTQSPAAPESGFSYQINNKIVFASADAKGNFLISNPEENTTYMQVDVIRNDTQKSVYFSGFITPGQSIKSAALQGDPLENGVYECTAIITVFDTETRSELGREQRLVAIYVGVKP